jgi:hypothetical protein
MKTCRKAKKEYKSFGESEAKKANLTPANNKKNNRPSFNSKKHIFLVFLLKLMISQNSCLLL